MNNSALFNAKAVYEAVLEDTIKRDGRLVYFEPGAGFFEKHVGGEEHRIFIDPLEIEDQIEAGKKAIPQPMTWENIAKHAALYEAAEYYERYVYIDKHMLMSSSNLAKEWRMRAHIEANFKARSGDDT